MFNRINQLSFNFLCRSQVEILTPLNLKSSLRSTSLPFSCPCNSGRSICIRQELCPALPEPSTFFLIFTSHIQQLLVSFNPLYDCWTRVTSLFHLASSWSQIHLIYSPSFNLLFCLLFLSFYLFLSFLFLSI